MTMTSLASGLAWVPTHGAHSSMTSDADTGPCKPSDVQTSLLSWLDPGELVGDWVGDWVEDGDNQAERPGQPELWEGFSGSLK